MLGIEERDLLKRNGFTMKEIEGFNEGLAKRAQSVNLDEPAWQDAMKKRLNYVVSQVNTLVENYEVSRTEATWWVLARIDLCHEKLGASSLWLYFRSGYERARGHKTDYNKAVKAREKARAQIRKVGVYKPIATLF